MTNADQTIDKIPVLLLVSTAIDLEGLNHSPRFSRYQFHLLDALHTLESSESANTDIQLLTRLDEVIQQVKPVYLIVHLGLAFERYPCTLLTTVLNAKEHYPLIKIGFDRGLDYVINCLQNLSNAEYNHKLILQRLVNSQLISWDEEIIHLASCLG
jgi:hypothetical protein